MGPQNKHEKITVEYSKLLTYMYVRLWLKVAPS